MALITRAEMERRKKLQDKEQKDREKREFLGEGITGRRIKPSVTPKVDPIPKPSSVDPKIKTQIISQEEQLFKSQQDIDKRQAELKRESTEAGLTALERQISEAERQEPIVSRRTEESAEAQRGAVIAQTAQARSGPQASTANMFRSQFTQRIQEDLTTAKNVIQEQRDKREDLKKEISRARESGDLERQEDINRQLALSFERERAAEANLEAQQAQSNEEVFDLIKTNDSSLVNATPEDLLALSVETGIPSFLLSGIQTSQKIAQSEDDIKRSQGIANLQKTMLEIENFQDRNMSPEGRLIRDRQRLVSGGASDDEIARFDRFAEANPNFQTVKSGDDVYAFNPKTGKTEKVVDGSGSNDLVPTGKFATNKFNNKDVTLDESAMVALSQVNAQMVSAGLGEIQIGSVADSSYRSQADTIARMAQRFNIGFNASNPNETAQQLRDMGHRIANVGRSKHEKGLALDVWWEDGYVDKVKPFLEANGWKQPYPGDDPGHFEFQGKVEDTQRSAKIRAFVQSRSGVRDKDARLQLEKDIKAEIDSGRASSSAEAKINLGIVTPEDKEVKTRILSDLKPIKTDTEEILRNVKNIDELAKLEGGIGDTAAITAFLKTIDPGSVARESEVAGVESARGLLDSVNVFFAKLKTGDRLSTQQRTQLQDTANVLGNLAREKLFERLVLGKEELLERGVDPTVVSDFQINKLKREIGDDRANQILIDNGLLEEKTLTLEDQEQIEKDNFIISQAPQGKIPIRRNGVPGFIEPEEFDSSIDIHITAK